MRRSEFFSLNEIPNLFRTSSIKILFKLNKIFSKIRATNNKEYLKIFINEYYKIEKMPNSFYENLLKKIKSREYYLLLKIVSHQNIFLLIKYLKKTEDDIFEISLMLTPLEYYQINDKQIDKVVIYIKNLPNQIDNYLKKSIQDNSLWKLRKNEKLTEPEYRMIAYKMYLIFGFDNCTYILNQKYGQLDYQMLFYLFSELEIKTIINYQEQLTHYFFNNKKDANNIFRQMLNGQFNDLFLNFSYFCNNFNYFLSKLGINISKEKLIKMLQERYLAFDISNPEITGDILEDMLSSYNSRFEDRDLSDEYIYEQNFKAYNSYLRNKYKSSIPMIDKFEENGLICEVLALNDPRNLVLGYRAGNCFRINGQASILFYNFLQSSHMRLVSISTKKERDYAMMLVMRNGNVLIGQGIEVSNRVGEDLKGEKLYNICVSALEKMSSYMNANDDEIIAKIIGLTNSNVANYNQNILPFIIPPLIKNANNFYNGISNYQCLISLTPGKNLNDIHLYEPEISYYDERTMILRRTDNDFDSKTWHQIEKRLIALRYLKFKENNRDFYANFVGKQELYVACNKDWYIILFDDHSLDTFIMSTDERAKTEYAAEMDLINKKFSKILIYK